MSNCNFLFWYSIRTLQKPNLKSISHFLVFFHAGSPAISFLDFGIMDFFYRAELSALCPTPNLEDHVLFSYLLWHARNYVGTILSQRSPHRWNIQKLVRFLIALNWPVSEIALYFQRLFHQMITYHFCCKHQKISACFYLWNICLN